MAAVMPSAMAGWPHHQHNMSWHEPMGTQYSPYQPMTQPYIPVSAPQQQQRPSIPMPGQSGPWTTEEDSRLMDAKSEGLAWNDIKLKYFPNKTGNACRKRHERLMQKLRTTDWDEARIRRVTNAYTTSGARERFWKEIARRVDEDRWEDVERVCFQQGLKNLRNTNASQSRGRSRASSGNVEYVQTPSTGGEFDAKSYEHDDSGFAEGLAVGSRRSSHGHGHSHGHSQSISLPVSGVQALSGLDFLGDQHQHQQAMIRPTHQRQMSHQQLSLYQ